MSRGAAPWRPISPRYNGFLQIEQVSLNLVRNSIEAIRDSGSPRGTILNEAKRAERDTDGEFVEIGVIDSGPDFRATTSKTEFYRCRQARAMD